MNARDLVIAAMAAGALLGCQGGPPSTTGCELSEELLDDFINGGFTSSRYSMLVLLCENTNSDLANLLRHVRPAAYERAVGEADPAPVAHALLQQRCGGAPLSHETCHTLRYLRDDPISEAVVAGSILYDAIAPEYGEFRARFLALTVARVARGDRMIRYDLLGPTEARALPVWFGHPHVSIVARRVVDGAIAGDYLPPPFMGPKGDYFFDGFSLPVVESMTHDTPFATYAALQAKFGDEHRVGVRMVVPQEPTDARTKVPEPHDFLAVESIEQCFGPCEEPTLFATLGASRWTLRQGERELVGGTPDEVLLALRRARCDMSEKPEWFGQTIGLIASDATTVGDALSFVGSVQASPRRGCWDEGAWVTVVSGG